MLRQRRYLWTPIFAATLLLSCVQSDDPTGIGEAEDVFFPIQPALIPSPADASADPVDRIRLWATRDSDGVLVGQEEYDVDPNADEWSFDFSVRAPYEPGIDVRMWAVLLATQGAQEEIQFSGIAGPFNVSAGQLLDSLDLPIIRGPIANHYVTSVTVESAPDSLAEGASAPLTAVVESSDTLPATVYWTALDSAVVSVADSMVTGVAPGVGRVVASVGSWTDTASIVVTAAPASVVVSPDSATVAAPGLQTTFTAVVLDARGDTLPEGVVWSAGNSQIASSVGDGVFEGVAPGSTPVTAAAASNSNVSGSGVLTVLAGTAPGVDIEVSKSVDEAQPLADSVVTFTVSVANLGGDAAADVVVFDTIPSAPFTNVQHAVTVGSLDGDTVWTIPTLAVGDTAIWTTTATVLASAVGTGATNTAFIRSVAANDTTPQNDTSAVTLNFPVSAIPVVQITSPTDGAVFDPGDIVNFGGTANDAEDGDLTPQIVWVSSVDDTIGTGASFETQILSTGVHTISASATDSDGGTGADTVTITIALITTPPTLNVPFGAQASLPITLSEPARPGGVTLDVTSADNGIATPTTATVFIPEGALSSNATLDGVQPGTVDVTVSHPQFGASVTSVAVTANLNIVQGSLNVPETFPQIFNIQLESQGSPTAAPAGGIPITLVARDPGCVAVPGSTTIQAGLVSVPATAAVGPSPPDIPCSSWVVASAQGLDADSVNVNITAAPGLTFNNLPDVGAGLQVGALNLVLGAANHGGTTVTITSSDPASVLVTLDVNTPGAASIQRTLANGQNFFSYYAQALEGALGEAELVATATGFNTGVDTITIVPPALEISSINTSTTSFTGEDLFFVRVGTPNAGNDFVGSLQRVRPGGDTVFATVSSSDPAVGELVTLPDSTTPVTVGIPPGAWNSAGNVATGGVALLAGTAGTTTVSATIPGYTTTVNASRLVTVGTPGISPSGATVGSGLMVSAPWAVLAATNHGGITMTISSRDPALALISPDENTAGTASIDVVVADGQNIARYWVHGLEGQTGSTWVDVSAPGFAPDSAVINVLQPAVDISGLSATTTSFSIDDVFRVRIGVPNAGQTFLSQTQPIRAGADTVLVTLTSSDPPVAELITLPDSTSPVTLPFAERVSITPSSVATGGAALTPVGAGTTTVTAAVPGFITLPTGSVDVTVTAPGISNQDRRVGSGLQYAGIWGTLGASDHPGVTVRVESTDPAVALISPNDSTPGTTFIDVPMAAGQTRVDYVLQGVEAQAGVIPVVMSAPGFVPDTFQVTVEPATFDIIGLGTSYNTFSADDDFQVRIGVPFGGNSSIQIQQSVRAGADTVTFTLTNSNAAVAQLETQTSTGQSVGVSIAPRQGRSGVNLPSGGATFDPLGIGTTTVTASAPGFTATTAGSQAITVSAPTITVPDQTVGAGLQHGALNAFLSSTAHGGVTVTLTSSNPSVFVLSPNDSTAGTASIDVVVPNGQNRAFYYVQGVEGADAAATLTVTANGFTNGVATVTVVPPAFEISSLSSQYNTSSNDDAAWVTLGIPFSNNSAIQQPQELRPGSAPLTVTIDSSNPAAGQLVTSTTSGGQVQFTLVEGEFRTPTSLASGGFAFDPVAAGSTTVSATISGFVPTIAASRPITITP